MQNVLDNPLLTAESIPMSSLKEGDVIDVKTRNSIYTLTVEKQSSPENSGKVVCSMHSTNDAYNGWDSAYVLGTAISGGMLKFCALLVGGRLELFLEKEKEEKRKTLSTSLIEAISINGVQILPPMGEAN